MTAGTAALTPDDLRLMQAGISPFTLLTEGASAFWLQPPRGLAAMRGSARGAFAAPASDDGNRPAANPPANRLISTYDPALFHPPQRHRHPLPRGGRRTRRASGAAALADRAGACPQ